MSSYLQIDHMPGPTDEARQLQYKQYGAVEAMYDAWNKARAKFNYANDAPVDTDPEYVASKAAYEATVTELTALLGADAHCNFVDCDLWSAFSDCYKDENGIRPRFHQTRQDVQDYFDQLRKRKPNEFVA
jgi:hypothetical protein